MLDDILFIYDKNFGRVRSLLTLYSELTKKKKGRRSTEHLDLLRTCVVLLHSTLEDFIRNLLKWKLPSLDKEGLKGIPLSTSPYDRRKIKFELCDLIEHNNRSVKDVVEMSITTYLDTVSFNNTRDLSKWLNDLQIEISPEIQKTFPKLQKMILRRHNIVHQADRDYDKHGPNHRIKSITLKDLESWKNNVDFFVIAVNRSIRKKKS